MRSAPPTTWTALSPAAAAWGTADPAPSVTKVKVSRSSWRGRTAGGWWVTTKLGTWNS